MNQAVLGWCEPLLRLREWSRVGRALVFGLVLLAGTGAPVQASSPASGDPHVSMDQDLNPEAIAAAAGTTATVSDDGVVRIGWARTDVAVQIDGMDFPAPAGLGSWAAFAPLTGDAMVMGDTVVFQDEVDAAMDAAFAAGLSVTALHNHFFFDEPKVYFMHIGGRGQPTELARGVKSIWDAIKAVRKLRPQPARRFPGPSPQAGTIDPGSIEEILKKKASVKGGVVKIAFGREAQRHGKSFGASMGLTSWAAFTGSDELASIDGDFAVTAKEVQPVLREMRRHGFHVVALHNHMVGEAPAIYFVHYWATDSAANLARAFRAVLEEQAAVQMR